MTLFKIQYFTKDFTKDSGDFKMAESWSFDFTAIYAVAWNNKENNNIPS